MPDEKGNYIYMTPNQDKIYPSRIPVKDKIPPLSYRGFISLEFSYHLGIIKTRHGYASGIALDINDRAHSLVAGTIADDDTILVIPKEGISRQELIDALVKIIPGMKREEVESGIYK